MNSKIVKATKIDNDYIEAVFEYENGRQITHYMTEKAYNLHVIKENIMNDYGVPENEINKLMAAVYAEAAEQRDMEDDEY